MRREADPPGQRAYAVYLASVSFVALFTLLCAAFTVASALLSLAFGDNEDFGAPPAQVTLAMGAPAAPSFAQDDSGLSDRDPDDRDLTDAVEGGIAAAVAGTVLWFHLSRFRRLARSSERGQAAWRVWHKYVYAVCFIATIVFGVALVVAAIGAFDAAAPGVAGASERSQGVEQALVNALLAAAAFAIGFLHWRQADRAVVRTLASAVAPLPPVAAPPEAGAPFTSPISPPPDTAFAPPAPDGAPSRAAQPSPAGRRQRPLQRAPRPEEGAP